MISEKIKDLILARINFPDQEVLNAVEALAASAGALGSDGYQFDDVFPDGSGDGIANGVLKLADAFADIATTDKAAAVKQAFIDVFSAPTPEQEAAGEKLMASALDFDIAANSLNTLLANRLNDEA